MFLSEWREFPSVPCLAGKETWWQLGSRFCWNRARPWHASELVFFLVGLRTYQHPGTTRPACLKLPVSLHTRFSARFIHKTGHLNKYYVLCFVICTQQFNIPISNIADCVPLVGSLWVYSVFWGKRWSTLLCLMRHWAWLSTAERTVPLLAMQQHPRLTTSFTIQIINILSGLRILWAGSALNWSLCSTHVDHCNLHAPTCKLPRANALDLRVNLITV